MGPTPDGPVLKALLKRGALVTAANWPVVVAQFLAESVFKTLLGVPVVAGAVILALAVEADVGSALSGGLRQTVSLMVAGLMEQPDALAAYLAGVLVILTGGTALTVLVKAGTVSVLVHAEREAPALEDEPLQGVQMRALTWFSLERFVDGCRRLFRRYCRLAGLLFGAYALVGITSALALYYGYRVGGGLRPSLAGPLAAVGLSAILVTAVTVVNLLYLLLQIVMAARDCGVRSAARAVGWFLWRDRRLVVRLFLVVLGLVVLATVASILATAGLGFIAFVPVVGLAVVPIQLAAWLARGLAFQFLGLTALGAYARLYRTHHL